MKKLFTILLISLLCSVFYFISFSKNEVTDVNAVQWQQPTKSWYQQQVNNFLTQLKKLQQLHQNKASLPIFTKQFQQVRRSFKQMEMLIGYFDERPYNSLNSRLLPELELEKGVYEYVQQPHGLQVIESFLDDSIHYKSENNQIKDELFQAIQTADFLQRHPFTKPYSDTALAEAISRQLLCIAAMGVTGFDKPVLKDALAECNASLQGMKSLLLSFHTTNKYILQLQHSLQLAIAYVRNNSQSFESFDRLTFTKKYLQPAFASAQQWKAVIAHFSIPAFTSFFQKEYINHLYHYQENAFSTQMIALGKMLFNSNIMSSNQRISCASCHKAELAFADTVKLNAGLELTDTLKRNTPSLLNAAYHLRFQRDGHLFFLQDQFREVIFNHIEMGNLDEQTLLRRIRKSNILYDAVIKVFPSVKDSLIVDMPLLALEAYVHSLVNTNSVFDTYMNNDTAEIASSVKRGFNLFMGQAKCGTCHFMPVFNGVQPPLYVKEETEVIGVLKNDHFNRPFLDSDSGLYIFTHHDLHRSSFKVPTVRHLANTFPYMHNGSLKNLDQVLLFYNLGGGAGFMMGADVPNQTLDRHPLQLDKDQRGDIKAFLLSLN